MDNLCYIIGGTAIVALTMLAITLSKKVRQLEQAEHVIYFEHLQGAIIVRNLSYQITAFNPGASHLTGWTQSEVIGKKCYELFQTVRCAPLKQTAKELFENNEWEGEETIRHKEGHPVHINSRWTLVRDAKGKPKAIISSSSDMTAIKAAEEALLEAQAQLAHMMRITMLGELVGSIAHEINQPLAAISTYGGACLHWLEHTPPNVEEVALAVTEIKRDAERARKILQRIRVMARKSPVTLAPLDLDGVVEEALSLVSRDLARKNITVHCSVDPRPQVVFGDKIQLQQVLVNLLINAAQAMDSAPSPLKTISVSTGLSRRGWAKIVVSDTGPGLTQQSMESLFEAFFTTRHEGMGLGLSICRSIVQAHGGVISASNNACQGAKFKILIPSAPRHR